MQAFHNGRLPETKIFDRHGQRKRGDDALAYEASSMLQGVVNRYPRYRSCGGLNVSFNWLKAHLDDDVSLTTRVLTSAGFVPGEDGKWCWRQGAWPISKVVNMESLGDALADVVDFHRPVLLD